mgnify:CR=1 FL=1
MRHVSGFACALFALLAASFAAAEEVPAKRLTSRAPDYPASCRPPIGEEAKVETVSVTYTVSVRGLPEEVRVRESTNECFNETAIAAVRSWTFEPRKVDGKSQAQEDLETTFIFKFEQETKTEDFDARPLVRVQDAYPEKCMYRAAQQETVVVVFDVTEEGTTQNIRITESTNDCFNQTVIRSVGRWKYSPKTINGEPVLRKNVRTTITYVLVGGRAVAPQDRVDPVVARQLKKVQRLVRDGKYQEALDELSALESEKGDHFTKAEAGTFYQLRGVAKIGVKDYAGALDDLKIAQGYGLYNDELKETIAQLEQVVAAQEAQAAQEGDMGEEIASESE